MWDTPLELRRPKYPAILAVQGGDVMRAVGLSLVLAIVLASRLARADEPPSPADDELSTAVPRVRVVLTDGSEFTGELVEKVPQDYVTLKLDDGSIKRIDWEDIRFKHPPPAPPLRKKKPAAPQPRARDEAQVELKADTHDAELQRKVGQTKVTTYMATPQGAMAQEHDENIWETVCHAPCSTDVDPSQVFRVGGDGIVGSSSFHLSAGSHTLVADTGSTLKHGVGIGLSIVGGLALAGGLLVFAVTPRTIPDCPLSGACTDKDQTASIYAITLPLIGVGAVALGLGIWMVISSNTRVTVDGGSADDARLHVGPFQLDARGLVF